MCFLVVRISQMGSDMDGEASEELSSGSASRLRVVAVASFDRALAWMCLRRAPEALRVLNLLRD